MKYKAVVFDFDLTLADSSEGILICFKRTLERYGVAIPDDTTIYNTIGMTLHDAFDLLTGIPNNPKREEMRRCYVSVADTEMVKNTFFYDGIEDGLKSLQASGVKVGICSTKFRYRIVDSFESRMGCMPVDLIVGGEDVKAAKPDPQGLLECIKHLGVQKSETLYVGDNSVDAKTAENAGVDFAAVLTGSTTAEVFKQYPHKGIYDNAVVLIDSLNKYLIPQNSNCI